MQVATVSLGLVVLACVLPSPARCFAPARRAHPPPRTPPLTPRGASGSLEPQSVDDVDFRPESEHTWAQTQVSDRIKTFLSNRTASMGGGFDNLEVGVGPASKLELLGGKCPPVRLKLSSVAVKQLSASGGVVLTLAQVEFRFAWLLNRVLRPGPSPRPLRKPMDLHGSLFFTQEDVKSSPMVRSLVQTLVGVILAKPTQTLGTITGLPLDDSLPQIDSVECVENGRIRVSGRTSEAKALVPLLKPLGVRASPFAVSFRLKLANNGRVVVFDDFDMTGAGLRVDVPKGALRVEVDVGRDANIKLLKVRARGVLFEGYLRLSPAPPFRVTAVKDANSFLNYKIDLGAMFSALLGISSPGN